MSNKNTEASKESDYSIKPLSEVDELKKWTEFCAKCFSYKSNPPPSSYFCRHFGNDPNAKLSHVLTMVKENSNNIVSSTRVFTKYTETHHTSGMKKAGGIGEVCTDPSHQKRGLAKRLLLRAIEIMKQEKFDYSLLHASNSFWSVYGKVGYQNIPSYWTIAKVDTYYDGKVFYDHIEMTKDAMYFNIYCREFMSLHEAFMSKHCIGYIHRTKEYWESYIFPEYQAQSCLLAVGRDRGAWISYVALRNRNDIYQVVDFGYAEDDESVTSMFLSMMQEIFKNKNVSIKIPTFLFKLLECDNIRQVKNDDDFGWMYLNLNESDNVVTTLLENDDERNIDRKYHLIWPIDSF